MTPRIGRLTFWLAAILVASGGTSARAGDPLDAVLNPYAMFGFNDATGNLQRYDFATSRLTTIGLVKDGTGTTLTGIDGAAYIPGFNNFIAFWADATGYSHVEYVNTQTAAAVPVGKDIGAGKVTGATSANTASTGPAQWAIYVTQQVAPDTTQIQYTINDDNVVPSTDFACKITVLGAQISYGGQYNMDVTTRVKTGSSTLDPFGSFDLAVTGNVNDNNNPRNYIFPNVLPAGTAVSILGRSWSKKNGNSAGTKDSDWQTYMSVDGSGSPTQQLKVLRNGDAVPNIAGFMNQSSIKAIVRDYIDSTTNTIVLDKNQVIYLFELGTTDMSSSAADFQDLVALVTLAPSPTDLAAPPPNGGTRNATYNVSRSGSSITFTGTGSLLGTSSLYQTDRFVMTDTTAGSTVTVTTNSNLGSATTTVNGATAEKLDSLGFDIKLAAIASGVYTFSISSQNVNSPLTSITFKFSAGSVSGPNTATYSAVRNGPSTAPTPPGRLLKVDHRTGGYTQLMTLRRVYDGLASLDGKTFYASKSTKLYLLDPTAQTETYLGLLPSDKVWGLEFCGNSLIGYQAVTNQMIGIATSNGAQIGASRALGMTSIGTIVFMPVTKDPAKLPKSYD